MAEYQIPKNPTNTDVLLYLVRIDEKVDRVEAQATKTNGRVNSIEEWKTGLQAVAAYQKEHPTQSQQISAPNATTVQVMQPTKWFQSKELVGGVVAVLLALAAAVGIIVGNLPK